MTALTFAQLKTELINILDDDGATSATTVERALNSALRRVARAFDWPELKKRDFVQIVAPYKAGTVDVTNGSTSLTGNSTAWQTAAVAKRKFALGYRSPIYTISSVGGETAITLSDAYLGSTAAAQTYVIYEDRVSMPADTGKILSIWLHDDNDAVELERVDETELVGWGVYAGQEDAPSQFALIERDTATPANIQIRIGPYAPDKAYNLEVKYRIKITSDANPFDESREDVIIQAALAWLYQRDKPSRVANAEQLYERLLRDEIAQSRETETEFRVGEMTAGRVRTPGGNITLNTDGITTS